jgi:salicylate hydroxylase
MEDGAFLGRCLRSVISGDLTIRDALHIYEKARMPKAFMKRQVSFLNGAIWHSPDGELQEVYNPAYRVPLTPVLTRT